MNFLKVVDNTEDRAELLNVEFTKSTLLNKMIAEVQPVLMKAGVVFYPKGTPAESVNVIKSFCVPANVTVEESRTLAEYVKQSGVKPEEESFWMQKGYEPSPEELEELSSLYDAVLDAKKRILDITGFKSVNVVWTIKRNI